METKTFKITTSELSALIFSGILEDKGKKVLVLFFNIRILYAMKVHLNFQIRDLTTLHDLMVKAMYAMPEPGSRVKFD